MLRDSRIYCRDLDKAIEQTQNIGRMKHSSLLVTGATGTIGSFLADLILRYNETADAGIDIYLAGRNGARVKEMFPDARFLRYDLGQELQFDGQFDYVIHAAGNAHPSAFADDPVGTITGNVGSTKRLLDYLRDHNGKRLLYLSSGEVYGRGDEGLDAFEEDYAGYVDTLNPRYCYPVSKRAAENLCASYSKQYGLETVIVRPCHTYGPNITPGDSRAHAQFLRNAVKGEPIVLKSAGTQLRSYCYAADCASAIMTVLINGRSGEAYNIANPDSVVTIAGLAEAIAGAGDSRVVYALPDASDISRQSPIAKQVLSSRKVGQLGWVPSYDIESGVKHTVDILRAKCAKIF